MITKAQQVALYHSRRARRQRIIGGHEQDLTTNSLFFTGGRMRTPNARGTVAAAEEFTGHKSLWISEDFPQNYFYIALGNFYTDNTGLEKIDVSSFDLVGAAIHAFYGGTWKTIVPHSVAAPNPGLFKSGSATFAPGKVDLIGPFVFPDWVPAESQMSCTLRVNTSVGAFLPTSIKLRNGTNEGASRTVVGSDFVLTVTGAMGGTDGRFDGELMCPAYILARGQNRLDRPVFWLPGDSIWFGKNSNENILPSTTYGSMGAISIAMDSKVGKRRYPYSNWGCPGIGPDDAQTYKNALLRLAPNRPFTHVVMNDMNNVGGVYSAFREQIINQARMINELSMSWGDVAAPILHGGVLPKPGSTDWCTTQAGQTGSGQSYPTAPRYIFEDELKAGTIPYIDGVLKNERIKFDLADERDKWKLTGFATTISTLYVSGSTTLILAANPGIGSMVVVDPGGAINAARHITNVTGAGPFTCTMESGITTALGTVGTAVKTTYAGDSGPTGGTHPATPGHVLIALDYAEDLAARYG